MVEASLQAMCVYGNYNLAQHKTGVQEGVKYPCMQCDHMATSKSNLSQHKRAVNERVKYPCNLCAFQTCRKDRVKNHLSKVHNIKQ